MKLYSINPLYTTLFPMIIFAAYVTSSIVSFATNGRNYINYEYEVAYGGNKVLEIGNDRVTSLKCFRKLTPEEILEIKQKKEKMDKKQEEFNAEMIKLTQNQLYVSDDMVQKLFNKYMGEFINNDQPSGNNDCQIKMPQEPTEISQPEAKMPLRRTITQKRPIRRVSSNKESRPRNRKTVRRNVVPQKVRQQL